MALSKEHIAEIKKQLRSQIDHLPADQKSEAEKQITDMTDESVELLLQQQQQNQAIFRKIISKEIPSTTIDENPDALAVLEINPISKGHTIVIPKQPITDKNNINQNTKKLAKELVEKIKSNLQAKDVKTFADVKFGEAIIDLVPEYDTPVTLESERQQSKPEELAEVAKKINTIKLKSEPKKEVKKPKPKEPKKPIKLPRRIP